MSPKSRREKVPGTTDHLASTAQQQTSAATRPPAPSIETSPDSTPATAPGKSAYLTKYQQDLDLLKLNQRLDTGDITRADYDLQRQIILQPQAPHEAAGAPMPAPGPVPEPVSGTTPETGPGKSAYLTKYQQDLDLLKLNQRLDAGDITKADYEVQKQNILNGLPDETRSGAPPTSGRDTVL